MTENEKARFDKLKARNEALLTKVRDERAARLAVKTAAREQIAAVRANAKAKPVAKAKPSRRRATRATGATASA